MPTVYFRNTSQVLHVARYHPEQTIRFTYLDVGMTIQLDPGNMLHFSTTDTQDPTAGNQHTASGAIQEHTGHNVDQYGSPVNGFRMNDRVSLQYAYLLQ